MAVRARVGYPGRLSSSPVNLLDKTYEPSATLPATPQQSTPFYRDVRMIGILAQIAFVIIIILAGAFLLNNVREGLAPMARL